MPKFVLLTAHRRESHGAPLVAICRAVLRLVDRYPDLTIVVPVHPSPRVRQVVKPLYVPSAARAGCSPILMLARITPCRLEGKDRIKLVEPLDYEAMVHVARHAYAILTDSGGMSACWPRREWAWTQNEHGHRLQGFRRRRQRGECRHWCCA